MKFDSLIFDMDGTLWDAVDSYCRVWNRTYSDLGIDYSVTRRMLLECMGLPIDKILERVSPPGTDNDVFYRQLCVNEDLMMPEIGGTLYPGVRELIPRLARRYPLFMASNCGTSGLKNFLEFTGLTPYFTDTITFGDTLQPKDYNIRVLMERHGLTTPIYIGDTEGDCRCAHKAGISMMHVTYGFGRCDDADYSASSFQEVADILCPDDTDNQHSPLH